jgi:hypothetical protein
MIQVTVGHLSKMQEREAELRARGYVEVGHRSTLKPMEYSKDEDFAGGQWSFSLTWSDPDDIENGEI